MPPNHDAISSERPQRCAFPAAGYGERWAEYMQARGLGGVGMDAAERKRGHYLGTEIDEKWWRRQLGGGLFARGMGEFWIDGSALFFRRYLTKAPIVIPFSDVLDVKVGRWHSGRWAGGAPVVKLLWKKADKRLSSGFVFSRDARETEVLVRQIRSHMQANWNTDEQAHRAEAAKRRG
jgi:hypothetical protein